MFGQTISYNFTPVVILPDVKFFRVLRLPVPFESSMIKSYFIDFSLIYFISDSPEHNTLRSGPVALPATLSEAHPAELGAAVLWVVALHPLDPGTELVSAPLKPMVPMSPLIRTWTRC